MTQEEADRWKERGNSVSKLKKEAQANSVDLAITCYSLALNFLPPQEKDLKATILSNRSLMYKKQEKAEEALNDAQQCVLNRPSWSKVSCYVMCTARTTVDRCGCFLMQFNSPFACTNTAIL